MVGEISNVSFVCPFKGIDVTATPFKEFSAKPCQALGVPKGRVWRALKDKAEARQLDRIFAELKGVKDEERICAGHYAFLSELCRSPRKQREVEEYLSRHGTPKHGKRRGNDAGGTVRRPTPMNGDGLVTKSPPPPSARERRPSTPNPNSTKEKKATNGGTSVGVNKRAEARSRADSEASKASVDGGPSKAAPASSIGRKAGAKTSSTRVTSSTPPPGRRISPSTSPTRPSGRGRVQAIAAIFAGPQESGQSSPAKPATRIRKPPSQSPITTTPVGNGKIEDHLTEISHDNETLRQRVAQLEALLEKTKHDAELQEGELAEAVLQREVLASVRDELMKQLQDMAGNASKTTLQFEEFETLSRNLRDTTQRFDAAKQELDTLRGELVSALAQRDGQERNRQELARELKRVESREREASRRAQQLEQQVEELQKALKSSMEVESARTVDLAEQKDTEISRLENTLAKQKDEFLHHIEQIEEQTQLHRQQWERELQIAREETALKTEEVEQLRRQLEDSQTNEDTISLNQISEERAVKIVKLEERILELESLVAKQAGTGNREDSSPQSEQGMTSMTINDGSMYMQQLNVLRTELATMGTRYDDLSAARDGLQKEVEDARRRLAEIGATIVEKDQTIHDLKRQLNRWSDTSNNSGLSQVLEENQRSSPKLGGSGLTRVPSSTGMQNGRASWVLPEVPASVHNPLLSSYLSSEAPQNEVTGGEYSAINVVQSPAGNSQSPDEEDYFSQPLSPKPIRGTAARHSQPGPDMLLLKRYPNGPHPLRYPPMRPPFVPLPRSTSAPPPEGDDAKPPLRTRISADTIRLAHGDVLPTILADLDTDSMTDGEFGFLRLPILAGEFDITSYFLDLSRKELAGFPSTVQVNLANLTHLYLDRNRLIEFPTIIFNEMPKLLVLNLTGNQLERIPNDIANLCQLRELYLAENAIFDVGHGIGKLRKLEVLDLSRNRITNLPFSLFKHTESLECVDLSHNHLRFLPPSLGLLHRTLKGLFLMDNPLEPTFARGIVQTLLNVDVDAAKAVMEANTSDRAAEAERMLRRIYAMNAEKGDRLSYGSLLSNKSTSQLGEEGDREGDDADTRKRLPSADSGVGWAKRTGDLSASPEAYPLIRSVTDSSISSGYSEYLPPARFGSRLSTELSYSLIEEFARPIRLRCEGHSEKALQRLLSFLRDVHDLDPNSAHHQVQETQPYTSSFSSLADEQVPSVKPPSTTSLERRARVIGEMVATEKTYVRELQNLVELYMNRMQKEQWLSQRDMDALFGNVKSILMIHRDHLLPDLIKKSNQQSQPIGSVFLAIAPFLKMYSQYYNNFDTANTYLSQLEAFATSSSTTFSSTSGSPYPSSPTVSSRMSSGASLGSVSISPTPTPFALKKPIIKKIRHFLRHVKEHPQHTQMRYKSIFIVYTGRFLHQFIGSAILVPIITSKASRHYYKM
ncbi:uncharacterized protein SPPG_08893 [Spizellomyces punctatus DAOM BR117]|uniref:DH domain-containing protein n=1 Tax=Spizellomyces punctatus (strain DAOM BR117) TaxID=645134 RepID=A0A0L0HPZ2_SPIPD|nr:uncharacterized protein SPPG_08893 [Spizellomyces punctatus DAOM BR117]KND03496.1 hypothetical protein SPPG_08893 [Spizellomyces punctatus DAOM BR117]|eukprot:XP_016611535.1 hypothetical protein SPPG_08893 [Spizellomyces punctatus DAOM BR117]